MSGEGHPHQYHGMSDVERIAVLEANERNMARELRAMNAKLDKVVTTLSEMSGGKKAVMGMFGLIGGAIGVFATLMGLHLFGK
jgi:hypothetical protein